MNALTFDDAPAQRFVPVISLPCWNQAMQRATRAERAGQVMQALTLYQSALSTVQKWLSGNGGATPDECLSAFVFSYLSIAELQADKGDIDGAANSLSEVHQALLTLIAQQARTSAWHQAAVWHSRHTHDALVAHLMAHGRHPAIDRAFRSGCLTLSAPSAQVH